MVWGLNTAAVALTKGSSKDGSGNQEGKGPRAEVKPTSEPGEILLTKLFSFCALLKS